MEIPNAKSNPYLFFSSLSLSLMLALSNPLCFLPILWFRDNLIQIHVGWMIKTLCWRCVCMHSFCLDEKNFLPKSIITRKKFFLLFMYYTHTHAPRFKCKTDLTNLWWFFPIFLGYCQYWLCVLTDKIHNTYIPTKWDCACKHDFFSISSQCNNMN